MRKYYPEDRLQSVMQWHSWEFGFLVGNNTGGWLNDEHAPIELNICFGPYSWTIVLKKGWWDDGKSK